MDVAAFIFGLQDTNRLFLCDAAGVSRVMFEGKARKGLADNQTDIQGKTWMLAGEPARTIQYDDMIGVFQDDGARSLIWDDLLQVMDI